MHAIHASAKRTVPFTWHASSTTEGFFDITFPGILNDCQTCHLPGTFDFSATPAAAIGNRLLPDGAARARTPRRFSLSPYVAAGPNYGSGFSFNAGTGATTPAAATTLVMSPTVDGVLRLPRHGQRRSRTFRANGGSFYQPRAARHWPKGETCLICHGTGETADIAVVHSKNR